MDFYLMQESAEYAEGFRELLTERGYRCESGIAVKMTKNAGEKITVCYREGKAEITAPERAFLFRGLITLVMYLEENGQAESYVMEEKIWFDHNGCMLDCSRNCVASTEAVKAWIRLQAAVGMNLIMLYTEDTYEVPGYPYFGYLRGKYTKTEIQELDAYAKQFGIELIPCIQALGHLQLPLRWPAMFDMRDTSDILLSGDSKVYEFIRACIHQTAECFSTRRVHLGMDEAWTLGLGQYLIKNGYTPKSEIMLQHVEKVMEICREEGLEPMIWSDMYLRIHSPKEDYYDVPFDTDMRKGELPPEGMSLVYWDYYHQDEEFYRNFIRLHKQLTDQVIFAGGGWSWKGMVPDLKVAYAVTRPAYRACRAENLREAVYTLWGDDSTETPLCSALGPVLMAAEYGFGEEPDDGCIRRKFEFLTGCDYDAYLHLGDFDILTEKPDEKHMFADPSMCLFYQDLMVGKFDGQTEGVRYGAYYKEVEEKLAAAEEKRQVPGFWALEMKLVMDFYRALAHALSVKADLGLDIIEAYEKKDREKLREVSETKIPELIKGVESCRRLREKLWNREGKIFGWEVLDIRYRALAGRMESAAERITAYMNGTLSALPELEETRLLLHPDFTGEHRMESGYVSWINIASASALAWNWTPR